MVKSFPLNIEGVWPNWSFYWLLIYQVVPGRDGENYFSQNKQENVYQEETQNNSDVIQLKFWDKGKGEVCGFGDFEGD